MKIFVSEKARQDILRTFSYLAERNPSAAENLLRAIDKKFEELSRFPFIGRERSSLLAGPSECPGEDTSDLLHG